MPLTLFVPNGPISRNCVPVILYKFCGSPPCKPPTKNAPLHSYPLVPTLPHSYAIPPLAVKVVHAPSHISVSPLIVIVGNGCTVTVTLVEA